MTLDATTVNMTIQGRVATIEMNRPQSLNSLNKEILRELLMRFKEVSLSEEVDIVVLTGRGRAFSSGGDIKSMLAMKDESDFFPMMDLINELVVTVYNLPKLTISAVAGAAAGLGLSLAMATDYILADENSKIAMNFIGIGLIPDGGSHFFLEQRMGEDKAKQLIWEGKTLNAEEAKRLSLIHEVTPDLSISLNEKLDEWLHKPIKAMIKTKKILAERNRPNLLKVLELEKVAQLKMRKTEDHQEGIQAFVEKRKPQFQGK